MQIMTLKTTTGGTFWVSIIMNCVIFPEITYNTVASAWDFLPVKIFIK